MKKLILSLALVMMLSATSFAGVMEGVTVKTAGGGSAMITEDGVQLTYDEAGNLIDTPEMSYVDPYYQQGVSVNVEVREAYVPKGVVDVASYYSVYGLKDAETARKQLEGKFAEAKSALAQYGKVRKSYINVYGDTGYDGATGKYTGSMDVTLEMKSLANYDIVSDKFSDLGFNTPYINFVIAPEEAIMIEERNAAKLRDLIAKKKSVYETILGYSLGKINSLSVSTWVDTYNYDSETGEFEAVVSAYAVLEESK